MKPGTSLKIGLFAPAGALDPERCSAGIKILEKEGFEVYYSPRIFSRWKYLAGSDQERAQELKNLLLEGNCQILWAARGGYGCLRLLPFLEDLPFLPSPPIVIGFSDLTILLLYLHQRYSLPAMHAPTVSFLPQLAPEAREALFTFLKNPYSWQLEGEALQEGEAEGELYGGNLASLASLLGTPYFPNLKGKVLLLEETGEKPYRLDRLFTQLALAGIFQQVAGLILGDLCGFPPETYLPFLQPWLPSELPVGLAFPVGHIPYTRAFPIGVKVRLKVKAPRALLTQA